ncbi:hypothetical protein VJI72_07960, partial [Parvimonas micra]|nr:hypothetical protein [Parvimonas micra]
MAPADGDKGPAVGGRAYQRYRIAPATTVLLPLQQVSSLQSPPGEASDVTGDALYGATRLTLTMNSFNARQLRPVNALASSVDVSNQLIRIWTKPVANV